MKIELNRNFIGKGLNWSKVSKSETSRFKEPWYDSTNTSQKPKGMSELIQLLQRRHLNRNNDFSEDNWDYKWFDSNFARQILDRIKVLVK